MSQITCPNRESFKYTDLLDKVQCKSFSKKLMRAPSDRFNYKATFISAPVRFL